MTSAMTSRMTTLGITLAAMTALTRPATAQFAGCAGEIPAGMSVYEELLHDDGSGPTHLVTAGGPGGVQRTIHHGVRFVASGELITHVCLYADAAGDPLELRLYQGDTTQFNDIRPGGQIRQIYDTIQGGWQLVAMAALLVCAALQPLPESEEASMSPERRGLCLLGVGHAQG